MPFETLQTRSSFRSRTGEWRLHAPTPILGVYTPLVVCGGEMKTKTKSCSTSSAGRLPPHSPRDTSIQEGKDNWACGRCVATVSSACLGRCTPSQDGSAPHYALLTPSSFPFPPHPPPSPLESKWASSITFSLHNGSIVHSLSRRIHPLSQRALQIPLALTRRHIVRSGAPTGGLLSKKGKPERMDVASIEFHPDAWVEGIISR